MTTTATSLDYSKKQSQLLLISLAISAAFVLVVCLSMVPIWDVNDDIGMSMIAHGYGDYVTGSPNLVFSNVVWGYLVRLIPTINGVFGYSIATFGVIVMIGAVFIFWLIRSNLGFICALAALILLLMRPLLFPQFTINAGLLTVAAIVCFHVFVKTQDKMILIVGSILALMAYLVRKQEFILVILVALPLLPWQSLKTEKALKIAVVTLLLACGLAELINYQAYLGPEWQAFKDFNVARIPFTDYGAGEYLKARPDILSRYGYSPNDIDLLASWFFVDPAIADPVKLNAMLNDLGPLATQQYALNNAWLGVKALFDPTLLPMLLAALALACISPTWKTAGVWGLCVAASFTMGLLGRPGILRVYVPLLCLLVITPLLVEEKWVLWRKRFATGTLLLFAAVNTTLAFAESKAKQSMSEQVRQGLRNFPDYPVVSWGAVFPYQLAYPPLQPVLKQYPLYGLNTFTHAPFSLAYAERQAGRSFTELLITKNGVPIIANEDHFRLNLNNYCQEHLHGYLIKTAIEYYGYVAVSRLRCVIK